MAHPNVLSHLEPLPSPLPPAHQVAMVEACEAGRISVLKRLLKEQNVKRGDAPIGWRAGYCFATREGAPDTNTLFAAAIRHGHRSTVKYLLSVYPKFNFGDGLIVRALIDRPDLKMLKLLHSQSPHMVSFWFDDRQTNLLNLACGGGPNNAPFIHFLLDQGADVSGVMWELGAALLYAVQCDQPIDVVRKIAVKSEYVELSTSEAIRLKRTDVVDLLLKEKYIRRQRAMSPLDEQRLRNSAQETKDATMIAFVESFIREVRLKEIQSNITETEPTSSGGEKDTESNKADEASAEQLQDRHLRDDKRKWWKLRTRVEPKDEVDAEDPNNLTDNPKWCLPLSKIRNKSKSADAHHDQEKAPYDSSSGEDM